MALNHPGVEGKRRTTTTTTAEDATDEADADAETTDARSRSSSSLPSTTTTTNQNGDRIVIVREDGQQQQQQQQEGEGDGDDDEEQQEQERRRRRRRRSGQTTTDAAVTTTTTTTTAATVAVTHQSSRGSSSSSGGGQSQSHRGRGDELLLPPRKSFQIPRMKMKERRGLYQCLPPDSREFEDLVKILSSFYLDSSSRGTFSYCKAKLIHNELLEKEFIEKRREMKQEGRTEQEMAESYCFLYPDKSKLQWICEKGLSVGHSRITTLGNPSVGIYLSKYADLLQINPFEASSSGDVIIFKVMRGRLKHVHENMPKNAMEPTPKFDCHVSKNANKVTTLLSYRAFELTQQYFFEFAFDEIKVRPRHICPYAVVSFQYKGKETGPLPSTVHRFNTTTPEVRRGKNYLVWSGLLVNKDQELFPACIRSTGRPYLPFNLPEKLEVSQGMQLDQVKRKIPSVLFCWDMYNMSREVFKYGMSCSLFDVVEGKGKAVSGSLAGLVHKLERDRMVLVKPLPDRGFLFLLSSVQMVNNKEQRGRFEKSLQALFIFQESRVVVKYASRLCEPEPLSADTAPAGLLPFLPALHYSLFKLRHHPGKDPGAGVERLSAEYLARMDSGTGRPFIMPDYKQNLDERTNIHPAPRNKASLDGLLRNYVHGPATYALPLHKARSILEKSQQQQLASAPPSSAPAPAEYSPVSEWGGSDRGSDRVDCRPPGEAPPQDRPPVERTPLDRPHQESSRRRGAVTAVGVGTAGHPNGGQSQHAAPPDPQTTMTQAQKLRMSQDEYDKEKMKQLLKLIQLHKKALVKEPARGRVEAKEDGGAGGSSWDPLGLKRRLGGEDQGGVNKRQRADPLSNGESSRGAQADDATEEGGQGYNLMAVMESMGIYDTDLRASRGNAHSSSSAGETQRLLKVLLATLNKAMSQGGGGEAVDVDHGETSKQVGGGGARREVSVADPHLRKLEEPPVSHTNYIEEDMDCSPGSPFPLGSPRERPHSSDRPAWSGPAREENAQLFPEPMALADGQPELKVPPVVDVKKAPAARMVTVATATVPRMAAAAATATPSPRLVAVTSVVEEPVHRPSISLDTILKQEVHSLTSDIRSLMRSQHIAYNSQLPPGLTARRSWCSSSFSDFVVPFVTPVPIQGHVTALCERLDRLVPPPPPRPQPQPPAAKVESSSPGAAPTPAAATTTVVTATPMALAAPAPAPSSAPKTKVEPQPPLSSSSAESKSSAAAHADRPAGTKDSPSTRKQCEASELSKDVYSPSHVTDSPESHSNHLSSTSISTLAPLAIAGSAPAGPGSASGSASGSGSDLLASSLLGQLKPEVFSSLMEVFKDVTKNMVKFYIYAGEEADESSVCKEIKEYLISLGNRECSPQTFLENSSSLDKLLIIIQNEDIAAHVHKIPALVSLKKLPAVSFAGVDTLDDVKNHTYNELFVSGGFIVSDEFVLNPDLITHERLQALLKFLEEQSTPERPWQWKVHCKSQKKLKEMGRLNTNAMALLNLLTAHQKKHLVEFLPYHECDAQARQAPDLDCLVKLQAQHTQQRHLIFLTERPFEMFLQYSRNGIVIASIDDIMSGFHSLIGSVNQNDLPTPPSTVVIDECVEEDMSLDSDDGEALVISDSAEPNNQPCAPAPATTGPPIPPPPDSEEFRPPLPEDHTSSEAAAHLSDYTLLRTAISQFKVAHAVGADAGGHSPGSFTVNPHQSFLCPSVSWANFTGYTASPAYPGSPATGTNTIAAATPQELDYRLPVAALTATNHPAPPPQQQQQPPPPTLLSNLASLPLEVKPPPPPHLMLLGHVYGAPSAADSSAGGCAPSSAAAQPDAPPPPSFAGTPNASGGPAPQGDRTLGTPAETAWAPGLAGSGSSSSSSSQPAAVAHPGPAPVQSGRGPGGGGGGGGEWTETAGSNSAPGGQGGRTPLGCVDGLGAAAGVGVNPMVTPRGRLLHRPKMATHGSGVYGNMAAMHPGHVDHGPMRGAMGPGSLGGFRGRGGPPGGAWPMPGRGHDPRGGIGSGPCSWGYPPGRGRGQEFYTDYTYTHN